MRRVVIGVLTASLIALLGFNWHRAEERANTASQAQASFDWSGVSSRDLNIAAVFLTARDLGVGRAMDSLQALTTADTTFRTDGHMIAHSLGRFAVANNRNDPSVLSQCRPTFQAGCYHGVLEGYLASLDKVDPVATSELCTKLARTESSPFESIECAHGLGHGFTESSHYELSQALKACEAFSSASLRTECADGVFMENAMHGLGATGMNVGDDAMSAHMHMAGTAPKSGGFHANDLQFPCDSVASVYQPSCWSYQPVIIASLTSGDFEKTLAACASAPAASSRKCYQGFGKQSLPWFHWSDSQVIASCQRAGAHASDCLAGSVLGLMDIALGPDRAAKFCDSAPDSLKGGCFAAIGTHLGRLRATPAEIQRDCNVAAKPTLIDACIDGSAKAGGL